MNLSASNRQSHYPLRLQVVVPIVCWLGLIVCGLLGAASAYAQSDDAQSNDTQSEATKEATDKGMQLVDATGAVAVARPATTATSTSNSHRGAMLVGSLTIFALAIFVGFEIITKVPPTLHTPLMSGSNAISGITVVGAILVAGNAGGGFGSFLGFLAVILATINVVGGFLVTHRMLLMFKKR